MVATALIPQKEGLSEGLCVVLNLCDGSVNGLKIQKWPEKWPEKCQLVLDAIRAKANVTIAELEKILNVGHTTVKKMLTEMQKEGFIIRVGADKGGYWEVVVK